MRGINLVLINFFENNTFREISCKMPHSNQSCISFSFIPSIYIFEKFRCAVVALSAACPSGYGFRVLLWFICIKWIEMRCATYLFMQPVWNWVIGTALLRFWVSGVVFFVVFPKSCKYQRKFSEFHSAENPAKKFHLYIDFLKIPKMVRIVWNFKSRCL